MGEYQNGERHGQGAIYRKNGVLTYEGSMEKGLPHGKGFVTDAYGDKVECVWIRGIDERLLEEENYES